MQLSCNFILLDGVTAKIVVNNMDTSAIVITKLRIISRSFCASFVKSGYILDSILFRFYVFSVVRLHWKDVFYMQCNLYVSSIPLESLSCYDRVSNCLSSIFAQLHVWLYRHNKVSGYVVRQISWTYTAGHGPEYFWLRHLDYLAYLVSSCGGKYSNQLLQCQPWILAKPFGSFKKIKSRSRVSTSLQNVYQLWKESIHHYHCPYLNQRWAV